MDAIGSSWTTARAQMPSPPTPPVTGFGGECGQRGVNTGKHTAQPPGCPAQRHEARERERRLSCLGMD